MKRPLWFYIPALMRALNWWDVRVLRKTVIRGIITYAPSGKKFLPAFETWQMREHIEVPVVTYGKDGKIILKETGK